MLTPWRNALSLYPVANSLARASGLCKLIRLYARKERPQAPPENSLDTATQVRTLFLS
jgi:hypothetical protein